MKSNQTLTILFWHRKSKADTKGFAPIICRISLDGLHEEFSIARKVHITIGILKLKGPRHVKMPKVLIPQSTETGYTPNDYRMLN